MVDGGLPTDLTSCGTWRPSLRHLAPFAVTALLPHTAVAAEVTDMPGAFQAFGGVHYSGTGEWSALEEQDVVIARRRVFRHDLNYRLQFAPIDGVALVLDIAHTPSARYVFPEAYEMNLEPVNGGGTYLLSGPGETAVVSGSGLTGAWIGAAFAPFAERYSRGQQATWRLDAAVRTGSPKHNLWTAPDGKRGVSPGGTAIKLAGAFSADYGVGNPWLTATYVKENKVTVDIVDEDGTAWAEQLELQPASTFDTAMGIEVVGLEDEQAGQRFAVDVFLGVSYRTWEDVASGVYLPNVIGPARQIAVTSGEHLAGRAGFAFDVHFNRYVRARMGPDVRIRTPFRPEHVYAVRTVPENIGVGWVLRVDGVLDLKAE